jgi:hypothetical protein
MFICEMILSCWYCMWTCLLQKKFNLNGIIGGITLVEMSWSFIGGLGAVLVLLVGIFTVEGMILSVVEFLRWEKLILSLLVKLVGTREFGFFVIIFRLWNGIYRNKRGWFFRYYFSSVEWNLSWQERLVFSVLFFVCGMELVVTREVDFFVIIFRLWNGICRDNKQLLPSMDVNIQNC